MQVWDIGYNIKGIFYKTVKSISEKQNKISDYVMKNIKINNKPAYCISYIIKIIRIDYLNVMSIFK